MSQNWSRRTFLQASTAGSALILGFRLHPVGRVAEAKEAEPPLPPPQPNAWLRISPDESVTIVLSKSEMGQGIYTGLPAIVADELEADWSKVSVEQPFPDPEYRNPGNFTMITGGSSSVSGNFERLRIVGAAAREMLVAAAAASWGVKPGQCEAANGVVTGPGGKQATYGALASEAVKQPVPQKPALKKDAQLKLIGKPVPRKDTPAKVQGRAEFAIDVRLPGMVYAAVKTSPVFGSEVANFDAISKPPAGTLAVLQIPNGIAVIADNWWRAASALESIQVKFKKSPNDGVSSAEISKAFRDGLKGPAAVAIATGNPDTAMKSAAKKVQAEYEVPFLAHATMEPMSCVADVRTDMVEVYTGIQAQEIARDTVQQITGLAAAKIRVHTTFLGGGFGRRFEMDQVIQAVLLSKALKKPVKVVWSREEDMQHDFYRPAYLSRFEAGLDKSGQPTAWTNRIVGPSIMTRVMPAMVKGGLDDTSVEGAKEIPYAIPNVRVDYVMKNTHVPVGFWRSVGSSVHAFTTESFIDELAHAAGKDPYEYRLKLVSKDPVYTSTLKLAAEKAGWGSPLPAGRGRGIAVARSFDSTVAEVVEASVADSGKVTVHRVVCAVHCGRVNNPDSVEAQIMSAVIFALSAALKGEITLKNGAVEQTGFSDYELIRMPAAPVVEVHVVPSSDAPTGIGEPGVPPLAPALANAIFALTGKRIIRLPIDEESLKKG